MIPFMVPQGWSGSWCSYFQRPCYGFQEAALQEMKLMSFSFGSPAIGLVKWQPRPSRGNLLQYRLDELYKDPKSGIRA